MAGSVGDVVQIGVEALIGTTIARNVFFYRLQDVPTSGYLTGLSTEFQSVVLTPLAALLNTSITFNNVSLLNIFSGDVLEDTTPTPGAGTNVNAITVPYNTAAMVLLTRENNRVRHGRKFVPMLNHTFFNPVAVLPAFLTPLQTWANTLDDSLNPGGVDEMRPVIVGRIKYTTPLGKVAYRLPTSQAEMGDKWSYVTSPRAINRPTTMNSRKFWRGE